MNGKHGWIVVGTLTLAFVSGCNTAPVDSASSAPAPAMEVFDLSDVDLPPRVVQSARPQYPFTLAQRGIAATVELNVVVLPEGSVGEVKVLSSTNKEFEASAIEAARLGKYSPAMRGDKPVACRVPVTIEYNKPKRT